MKLIFFLFCAVLLFTSISVSAQSRSGSYYRNVTINKKEETGLLKITEVKKGRNKYILFNLQVGSSGPNYSYYCVGSMEGKAKWISSNTAEFNSDFNELNKDNEAIGCRLTFIFSGNTVTIRETNCNDSHGVVCSFEGRFVLSRRKKRK